MLYLATLSSATLEVGVTVSLGKGSALALPHEVCLTEVRVARYRNLENPELFLGMKFPPLNPVWFPVGYSSTEEMRRMGSRKNADWS